MTRCNETSVTKRPRRAMAEFDCAWCPAQNPLAYHFCHRCGHAAHREWQTCDCVYCVTDRAETDAAPKNNPKQER